MTGHAWLKRYVEKHGKGIHVRKAAEARIQRRIRSMSPVEAKETLESFSGMDERRSSAWQASIIGGWSQSMDHLCRIWLGRRMRQAAR